MPIQSCTYLIFSKLEIKAHTNKMFNLHTFLIKIKLNWKLRVKFTWGCTWQNEKFSPPSKKSRPTLGICFWVWGTQIHALSYPDCYKGFWTVNSHFSEEISPQWTVWNSRVEVFSIFSISHHIIHTNILNDNTENKPLTWWWAIQMVLGNFDFCSYQICT